MTPEEWQKARLIGENDDDERIDSADDEELDSDAAFDESDEDRYAGFFSSKGKKQKQKQKHTVKFTDVNLDEDENMATPEGTDDDEEEEGDPDEFIDLLDVLDGKGEVVGSDNEKPNLPSKHQGSEDEDKDEDEDSGGTEEESEEEIDTFLPSGDDDVPEASEEFQNFISSLDPAAKKRKAEETTNEPAKDPRSRKRRHITERTEAGAENEFRAHSSGSKLQLDDLLVPLATQSSNLLSLKKNTKVLSTTSTKVKALSAPLPQRTQDRLDREAAYEKTKEEVDKWSATMKRIREAEHLSFPLQARPSGRVSNLELAAKFKPSTKLESSIDRLLKSAKMRDEDIEQTEDTLLKTNNNLTVEQVAQRRAELRHMRELMFRAELKAKRINKIKSKTYRKIKRKEKEKLNEKMLEADGESDTEGGRLKREIERARERATLRHKHTGKWAKQMKQKHLDEGGRQEIEDMLERGEQLRKKIQGVGSDESEEESSDEEAEDVEVDTEEGVLRIKKAAFDELKQLNHQLEEGGTKGKGVFEMKFMKDAMAKQQTASNKMVDDFIKEMGGSLEEGSGEEQDQGEDQNEADSTSGVLANRTGGRVVYRPGVLQEASRQGPRPMGSLASDTSSVTLRSTDVVSPPASPQQKFKVASRLSNSISISLGPGEGEEEVNPWLKRDTDILTKSRKKTEVFGKDSERADKSKNKLKKLARKMQEEKERAQEDATVEVSMDQNLILEGAVTALRPPAAPSKSIPPSIATNGTPIDDGAVDDSDANSEVDVQEAILKAKAGANTKGLKAFQQRDLVARAFAGDNVVHEFEEAKKREIAADAPKDIDTTIPGWGSWGGQGTKRAPPKPERIKKIAGVDPKSRADYNKKHVIISERRDKKAAKYLVKDLPYPYTSRSQYERSMDQPLGKEWNTRIGFQRGTLPRVVKKPGIIIDPLEKVA